MWTEVVAKGGAVLRTSLVAVFAVLTLAGAGLVAAEPVSLVGPEVVLSIPWGSGPGEVARDPGNESAAIGPMSFNLGPGGDYYVLDQRNRRVAVFASDGTWKRAIELPGSTFEELEVGADGRLLLLDRLVREALVILDPATFHVEEVPVAGYGIPEGGGITALFLRGDGVWLEYGREHSVRVLDSHWRPCVRTVVPGRPALRRQGMMEAALDGSGGADVRAEDGDGVTMVQAWVRDDEPIVRLAELADGPGTGLWVVYHLMRFSPDGDGVDWQGMRGRLYGPGGEVRATFASPWVLSVLEQFREFRFLDDGSVLQWALTAEGAKLIRWRAP